MQQISIMNERDMERALTRIAHEIIEGNHGVAGLALIGVRRRGLPLAQRLGDMIERFEGKRVPIGGLDITYYRDDLTPIAPQPLPGATHVPFAVDDLRLVIVDDVIYTGRTARAAIDAIMDLGRPAGIRLAELIDRGHRELPIRPDYVGKNVPTARSEHIEVRVKEIDGEDGVALVRREA
ncbi:MAG: bifunctional pyr operon transcriptional regulator/uracil phosphoribosyltransferase PyrR [Christensenellaceae bacterium]|jgi:pyrimidine operon attenuation protein/uracil phosphoribosyltransferase|nr:bifunctional pyr operon transcriptional regulator/uracil phosphoribosyltransferase PyrR [Christensenellaceae bacterium]